MNNLNAKAFAGSGAFIAAVFMLLLGILANIGIYEGAAEAMMKWHMFFSLSIGGIIGGIIEAAIISYIFCYAFVWMYNKLANK